MTTIYLVEASRGEYENLREWIVCAFTDRAHAEAHRNTLQANADAYERVKSSGEGFDLAPFEAIEPNIDSWYHITYQVYETELKS